MRLKRKRVLWIGAALVVVLGVVAVMAARGRGGKAPEVQTTLVSRQNIVQKVNGTGRIQPKTQVKISADVSARITKLAVTEGQWVEKGALLVELDRNRYLAAVQSAEASVRSARANAALTKQNMDQSEKDYARSKELLARGLESQSGFDARQTAHQVEVPRHHSALEQVAQAQAALRQARDDLSKTTIYAPMSGTVSELNKEAGEMALGSQFQADVILVIADLSEMEAQVDVDENDIVNIAIGQPAEIQVDALPGQVVNGAVREIGSSANSSGTGTAEQKTEFAIKIAINEPLKTLRPGMTATADIVTKTNPSALSVPLQSVALRTIDQLVRKGEKRKDAEAKFKADRDGFVEIVFALEQGRAMARQVTTGIQSDEWIEIKSGLKEGDEVVSGSYRAISKDLENGATVRVNNEKAPEKPDATASRD
ncbi:MAG: efflux RND transporter periplasmic adaptor subunit [Candidatus Eiseniibacteriota bacterium]